jgi:hypothetical protein
MQIHLSLILLFLLFADGSFAQSQKARINDLFLKGEAFKEGEHISIQCTSGKCWNYDELSGISFTLSGTTAGKPLLLSAEIPFCKGTYKIKVDQDGDLGAHEKLELVIYGPNAPVDNVTYTVEDEMDEALVTITNADKENGILEGTLTAKFYDSATAIKRLTASCHFVLANAQ